MLEKGGGARATNQFLNMKKDEQMEKILILAEKVKLLFGFCANLISEKEMLKDTYNLADERHSLSLGLSPILGAFGENYEDAEMETRIRKERAKALYELVETLDRTEKERVEYGKKKTENKVKLAQLHKALGL